jgi:dTMP kinase
VLGPLAGAFADRFDRRRTMVVGDAVRFVLFLTIPLAHLVVDAHRTLLWLYIASFLIECISLFWLPAKDASVPNLVRRDQIESANQLSLITTYGITPVLAAALFSVLSLITNVLARHVSFFRTNPTNLAHCSPGSAWAWRSGHVSPASCHGGGCSGCPSCSAAPASCWPR